MDIFKKKKTHKSINIILIIIVVFILGIALGYLYLFGLGNYSYDIPKINFKDNEKNDNIDQIQDYSNKHGQSGWSGFKLAQSFIPIKQTLSKIELLVFKEGNPPGVTVSIREKLDGNNLTSIYIDGNEIYGEFEANWHSFNFEEIELKPGQTYYIVWEQYGGDNENVIYWAFGENNPYIYGCSWKNTGSWEQLNTSNYSKPDLCFKTYYA
jgi:hypothetical protein